MSQTPLNTWDFFPSDHAAVLFSLAAVICLTRPRLRMLAFVWMAFAESSRAHMGAHYTSDLIGGAALGSLFVWTAQGSRMMVISRLSLPGAAPPLACFTCARSLLPTRSLRFSRSCAAFPEVSRRFANFNDFSFDDREDSFRGHPQKREKPRFSMDLRDSDIGKR